MFTKFTMIVAALACLSACSTDENHQQSKINAANTSSSGAINTSSVGKTTASSSGSLVSTGLTETTDTKGASGTSSSGTINTSGSGNIGSSSSSGGNTPGPSKRKANYSALVYTPASAAQLVEAEATTLESHIKNGIRLQLVQYRSRSGLLNNSGQAGNSSGFLWWNNSSSSSSSSGFSSGFSSSSSSSSSSNSSSSGGITGMPPAGGTPQSNQDGTNYSDTNRHILDVDEADVTKYDGQHWYVTGGTYSPNGRDTLRIAKAGADPSALGIAGEYTLEGNAGPAQGLHQIAQDPTAKVTDLGKAAKEIVVLRSIPGNSAGLSNFGRQINTPNPYYYGLWDYTPPPQNGRLTLQWVDVQNAAAPKSSGQLVVDGTLIQSRKIDDVMYLTTRYEPWLATLKTGYDETGYLTEANEELIAASKLEELLPHYQFDEGERQLMGASCFIPAVATENNGLTSLLNITAIDLRTKKVISSTCINANLDHLQITPTSAYVVVDVRENFFQSALKIHKFSLRAGHLAYAASGDVEGDFDGGDIGFRMSESGDFLRVVTTSNFYDHQISVLRQNGTTLERVARLPNPDQPDPIGKPLERLYGVRFIGTRAYVVTFVNKDPLYVIDLADNTQPKILGALEIPGFATYIHPVGDNYLFTLGNAGDEAGRVLGVKAELINVTDPTQPSVITTLLLGGPGSGSKALYDLQAMSFLQASADQLRITLPLDVYGDSYNWINSGLQLLEINGLTQATPSMRKQGEIVLHRPGASIYYPMAWGDMRGLMHGDAVYLKENGDILSANWHSPQTVYRVANDPYTCEYSNVPRVVLTVKAKGANPCDASLDVNDGIQAIVNEGIPSKDGASCSFQIFADTPYVSITASLPNFQSSTSVLQGLDCPTSTPLALELYPLMQ